MLAAALADERSRDTDRNASDPVLRESRALIAAAKRTGGWLDPKRVYGERISLRTGESQVFWNAEEHCYCKIKNPFAKLHLKKHAAVLADKRPTDAQIARHLAGLGLKPEGRYAFGDEVLFVTDVGENGDNVLFSWAWSSDSGTYGCWM